MHGLAVVLLFLEAVFTEGQNGGTGVPDPPTGVTLQSCLSTQASVRWTPGTDNGSPVTTFTIYYNTSYDPPGVYNQGASGDVLTGRVRLSPYTTYKFYVTASNAYGESARSAPTPERCRTPPSRPYTNPRGVCTDDRGPGKLAIVWEPMPLDEHNGPGFRYIVSYHRRDEGNLITQVQLHDWQKSDFVFLGQPIYKEYEISVQAVNHYGRSPCSLLQTNIGHSGQGAPYVTAENFMLEEIGDATSLGSRTARFSWDPVDPESDNMRGFFVGYQVSYWLSSDEGTIRTHDLLLREYTPCAPLSPQRHRRRTVRVSATVPDLWPLSQISACVSVLIANGATGPQSNMVTFLTPDWQDLHSGEHNQDCSRNLD